MPSEALAGEYPGYEEIARRAYEIYEHEGRPEGKSLEHWLKAEVSLLGEREHRSRRFQSGVSPVATRAGKPKR